MIVPTGLAVGTQGKALGWPELLLCEEAARMLNPGAEFREGC